MRGLDWLYKQFTQKFLSFFRFFKFLLLGTKLSKSVKFYGKSYVIGYYTNISLGQNVVVNLGVVFNSRDKIIIGNGTHLSSFCKIYTGKLDFQGKDFHAHVSAEVVIGNNCWLGSDCIVLGGVSICDNVVVAAGSVVTKSILVSGLYAGSPAKIIREF